MKIKSIKMYILLAAIMISFTIAVTYYVITSNSVTVPKSATLVMNIEVNKNG